MSNIFVTGGQVSIHSLRMLKQVISTIIRWSAVLFIIFSMMFFALKITVNDCKAMYYLHYAHLVKNSKEKFAVEMNGRRMLMSPKVVINHSAFLSVEKRIHQTALKSLKYASYSTLATAIILVVFFIIRGRDIRREEKIRGNKLVDGDILRKLISKHNSKENIKSYSIAKVPYPAHAENLHTLIAGSTGSGKTVLISNLIKQIKERGDKAIIYDKMGIYTERFFDEQKDVLLNPFDKRSRVWSIFQEVEHEANFDSIAAAFIPIEKAGQDPFWTKAARTIFSEVCSSLLRKNGVSNKELVDTLLKKNLVEAAELVKGTAAQAILDPESPKTALSVMSVLATYLKCFQFLQDIGKSFSIRNWIKNDDKSGIVFITSSGDIHSTLIPLISGWIEIAINNILSLARSRSRKIWIILDELPSLHTLPSLESGLAEVRQFGGCFVLSIQSISQLRDRYGFNGSQTISSLCNNKVFLRAGDPDSARWYSENIGSTEIEEFKEGLSYGANELRDGVNVNKMKVIKSLVLPGELLNIPFGEGYICMGGRFPTAKVKFDYEEFPQLNKAIEREVTKVSAENEGDQENDEIVETEETDSEGTTYPSSSFLGDFKE